MSAVREPLCKACTHPLSWRDEAGVCTHCGCTNHGKARGRRRGQFLVPPTDHATAEGPADALAAFRKSLHDLIGTASQLLGALPMPENFTHPGVRIERERKPSFNSAKMNGSPFRVTPNKPSPRASMELRKAAKDLGLGMPFAPNDDSAPMRILRVLVAAGKPLTRRQIAILANVRTKVSTYRNAITELVAQGYIAGSTDARVATAAGVAAAGPVSRIPSGPELADYWRRELGDGMPRLMLDVLLRCAREGREMSRDELAIAVDCEPDISTFRNAIGRLRTLDLVEQRGTRLALELLEGARS